VSIDPLIGNVLGKRYQIVRLLGQGGMGSVYEAVHCELDKKVAVKMLLPQIAENAEAYERFRREARAASRLRHPNILEVTDFDHTDDGAPYMVMEFMEGEDLNALLTREGNLPLDEALDIFMEVLDAVEAAHQGGIIHRDLKPENIFLSRYGSRKPVPKVLDFGISKIMDATSLLTRDQAMIGTPNYMAPEQATGKTGKADARTDVFALGAILYRVLTGREAFGRGKALSIVYRVVNEEPQPLTEARPGLPAAVEMVVTRAMAKNPDARYSSAAALAVALQRAARGGQTEATMLSKAHQQVSPGEDEALAATIAPGQGATPDPAQTGAPSEDGQDDAAPEPDPTGTAMEPAQTGAALETGQTGGQALAEGSVYTMGGEGNTVGPVSTAHPMPTPDLTDVYPHREKRSNGMIGAVIGAALLLTLGAGAWFLQKGSKEEPPAVAPPAVSAPAALARPDAAPAPKKAGAREAAAKKAAARKAAAKKAAAKKAAAKKAAAKKAAAKKAAAREAAAREAAAREAAAREAAAKKAAARPAPPPRPKADRPPAKKIPRKTGVSTLPSGFEDVE